MEDNVDWLLILFVAVQAAGVAAFVALWRGSGVPISRPFLGPRYIFRIVNREDRPAYVRMMRRTYAVAMRDLGRKADALARQIGNQLIPGLQRFADAINGIGKPPTA